MRKNNSTTPTQVKGGYLGAGSNFESVGVFVFKTLHNGKG